MTDRYAVIGDPIAHSKSPQIHAAFARETEQDMVYDAVRVSGDAFDEFVEQFLQGEGKGLNVTVPHKQRAWNLAGWRSPAAERAGAVNTLYRNGDGQICGDNTDGIGLVRDLRDNHAVVLDGARVLVLGAGGAVRGVLEPILSAGVLSLVVTNRTVEKAVELARLFGDLGEVRGCGFDAVGEQPFDLIINGTSASLQGELPPLPDGVIGAQTVCYDMMYGADPTPFCRWAQSQGARLALDGLGMLVEQAAESFRLWRGVRPETSAVIAELRRQLAV